MNQEQVNITSAKSDKSNASKNSSIIRLANRLTKHEDEIANNPFKVPKNKDIYTFRENEKERKRKQLLDKNNVKLADRDVGDKNRQNFRKSLKDLADQIDKNFAQELIDNENSNVNKTVKSDPEFTLNVTKDRHFEKETLSEYVKQKREMFLVQYLLEVKRDEIHKLEQIAKAEEKRLEMSETTLEQDAISFDNFLKHSDKHSVEAIKIAEAQTKSKLEKHNEIKKLSAQILAINSEINKQQDILKELFVYKTFLYNLSPTEWQNANPEKLDMDSSNENFFLGQLSDSCYFTEPKQLVNLLSELEETNLSLIQNSQDTEESLKQVNNNIENAKVKKHTESKQLKIQIEKLERKIEYENMRAEQYEKYIEEYNGLTETTTSESKVKEDEGKLLEDLNIQVESVYRNCVGEGAEASISTLQMLTTIENKLEKMFEIIEYLPQDLVSQAERTKEKERRLVLRQEKILLQKKHQEERIKKALERAKAAPKKQAGRKVMARSNPPIIKNKNEEKDEEILKLQQELAYYFVE